MKQLIIFLFLLISLSASAQVYDKNIRLSNPDNYDSIHVLTTHNTGTLAGRGNFINIPAFVELIQPYINTLDTVYINGGDSLVIITSRGDTVFFAGGGVGVSDGDKTDITVSGSGTIWNINAGAVGNTELFGDAVTHDKIAPDAVRASEIQAGAVGTSEIITDGVGSDEISSGAVGQDEIATNGVSSSEIVDGAVGNDELATGIDVSQFANGSVSDTEFQYLDGVTSSIQDQINSKERTFNVINTTDPPTSVTDSIHHTGTMSLGLAAAAFYGNSILSIDGHNSHSCLDLSIDNSIYSMRVKHDDFDCPLMYIDGRGAIYTASQIVISSAFENSGYGCQLRHPSQDQFMFGITSDVGGPGIQIHQSSAAGSYQISSLDLNSDYRWMLEADGTMRWGLDSIQDMDTDLFRADSAKLFTNGAFGVGWTLPTPTHIAGLTASGYLSKIFLGPGIEFVNDTLYNTGQDDDFYNASGEPSYDNTEDIYHDGDIHIGTNTVTSDAELNVIGRANILQSLTIDNIFINGGNYTASGTGNVVAGNFAGIDLTTGVDNVLAGNYSGTNITSGNRNVGMGYQSLLSLTTGSDNFGLGNDALRSATTQNNNVAIGASALYSMTAGDNVGIGRQAGYSNTSADNVFIGMEAGGGSSGDKNTIIGRYAGYGSTGRNINIGYGAGYSNTTSSRLFISSYNWANATEDYDYSIISGLMDATASNQILNLNAKVLPRYMGGTSTGIAGYDASGYLSTVGTGWGIDLTSGNLVVDSSQVATQYDLTQVSGGSSAPVTISPAQITSDQDNYAPTGIGAATYVIISGDSDIHAITGIVDSTAGVLRKTIVNGGSYTLYFPSEHPDSDAAHRFTGLSGDYKLYPGKSCDIFYDVAASRWRIITAEDENGRTGVFYEWSAKSSTAGDNADIAFLTINSGSIGAIASTTSLPATLIISPVSTTNGGGSVYFPKTAGTYSAFASAHLYAEAFISIPTLSDGTQTFTSALQIHTNPASTNLEDNNIIGIRYSHGINGGEWELFSQDNAAGEDVADSGVAVAAATLYKLRIEIDKSNSEARGYINDVYIGKVESNLPNAVACGVRIVHLKSAGSTARTLNVHSFSAGAIYK